MEFLRWRHVGLFIDPTSCEVPGWSQSDYADFWTLVLERHVKRVIFLDGWEYSRGCVHEFAIAQELGLDCVDEGLQPITRETGLRLLESAKLEASALGLDVSFVSIAYDRIQAMAPIASNLSTRVLFKDQVLDHLARTANVAQFVSFAPDHEQRYCRIRGFPPNHQFASDHDAVSALLQRSPERSLNIRSFDPKRPEGNPFIRRITSLDEALGHLHRLAGSGLYTIANEAIDEGDGGVSGVAYRGCLEFAPDANPRCVDDEEIDTAMLPFELGMILLRTVYGFEPDLRGREGARVEFSIHPSPRGWLEDHTIIWQLEQRPAHDVKPDMRWPHRFSRLIGDKAFGLTIAAAAALPVPRAIVFSQRLFPFVVGEPTGSREFWTRTCPEVKIPGYYPSARGWHDPFAVLRNPSILLAASEGSLTTGNESMPALASVLVQEEVKAEYSGTAMPLGASGISVHGVHGAGDEFMRGDAGADAMPSTVEHAVVDTVERVQASLGPAKIEWVFDGAKTWILQLNLITLAAPLTLPGDTAEWEQFHFSKGRLNEFRQRILELRGSNKGIVIIGNVSPLSHVGEIAEQYGVPVQFVTPLAKA